MKIIMKKSVSIQFSGCGRKKKRNFSATKVAAAVYGKFNLILLFHYKTTETISFKQSCNKKKICFIMCI